MMYIWSVRDVFHIKKLSLSLNNTWTNFPLPTPNEPWLNVLMNFVLGLPQSKKGNDIIFVVVDRFSKMTHLIACNKTNDVNHVVDLYFKDVVKLCGIFLEALLVIEM